MASDEHLASGCREFRIGTCSRRQLLRIGALGVAGLALPDWLRSLAVAAPRTPVRSVILYHHYGGPSHLDTWDPKPQAPAEVRGEFGVIRTPIPGYQVSDLMPKTARLCDRFTIVRSMTHKTANHNPAVYLTLTGRTSTRDAVQVGATPMDWPAYGSVLSKLAPGDGTVPPFVSLPHKAYDQVYVTPGQTGGLLGKRYDPLIIEQDPNSPRFSVQELALPADVSLGRLESRRELLGIVDAQIRAREAQAAIRGMDAYYQRAWSMLTSPEAKRAFDLSREDPKLREQYGRNKVGQSLLLSRRLIEAGVRFVTCFNGSSPGDGWDTHSNNFPLLKNHLVPPDDRAFAALVEDLERRGLLDSTLVIWAGEFGRKPHIGKAGFTDLIAPGGRDHWPPCYSVILAGGGVKGGYVYGSSDKIGAYPAERSVTPADLAATVFWALGIDPATEVHDQLGRPIRLADGRPVVDLFA